jgi:hypothetical protein
MRSLEMPKNTLIKQHLRITIYTDRNLAKNTRHSFVLGCPSRTDKQSYKGRVIKEV